MKLVLQSRLSVIWFRFQVGLDRPVTQTYRDILTRLPGGNKVLESAYETVEFTITSVKNYVDEWLRYQALWDLQVMIRQEGNSLKIVKWIFFSDLLHCCCHITTLYNPP